VEDSDGVRASADAGAHGVGKAASLLDDLGTGFLADDLVEVADHGREGVRTGGRSQQVVCVADVGHPVTECLVDGVFERLRTVRHGDHGGAEEFHPGHVQRLAAAIFRTHVDNAFQAQQRGGGGAGDAVLACAGLGDDAGLAHALGQEGLAQDVVDLVRAGVVQVLPLEEDPHSPGVFGETLGLGQEGWPAGVVLVQLGDLRDEVGISLGLFERVLKLVQGRDQRLGHPPATVRAEVGSRGVLEGAALQEGIHRAFVRAGCRRFGHQSHHPVHFSLMGSHAASRPRCRGSRLDGMEPARLAAYGDGCGARRGKFCDPLTRR
jgi:hypothetical protein